MSQPFLAALARKLYNAALRRDGRQLRDPHLDRLLDNPVHLVAAGDALCQHCAHRQLALRIDLLASPGPGALALDLQCGRVVAAPAVKKDDGAAIAQPENAQGMMSEIVGQFYTLVCCQRKRAVKAGLAHGGRLLLQDEQ